MRNQDLLKKNICHGGQKNTTSKGRKARVIGAEEWKQAVGSSKPLFTQLIFLDTWVPVYLCELYAWDEMNYVVTLTQLGKEHCVATPRRLPEWTALLLYNQASYSPRESHCGK